MEERKIERQHLVGWVVVITPRQSEEGNITKHLLINKKKDKKDECILLIFLIITL